MSEQTIEQWLSWGAHTLSKHNDGDSVDSERLLAQVLGVSRAHLFAWPNQYVTAEQSEQFRDGIQRLLAQEPLAYILGNHPFVDLVLTVTPATLIPRPETEHMALTLLKHHDTQSIRTVCDLGTGSGAIALLIKSRRPHWSCIAVDKQADALAVAQHNAQHHQLSLTFVQGDWLHAIGDHCLDLVICNPPYIAEDNSHLSGLHHEPTTALVAADNGLADIQTVITDSIRVLKAGGELYIEHGYDQSDQVMQFLMDQGFVMVMRFRDHAGHRRFIRAVKPYHDESKEVVA